jgi:restriction endonuclease Mrr
MNLGSYEQMIGPLLIYLRKQEDPVRSSQAYEGVAEQEGITDEEKRMLLPSGT